MSAKPAPPLRAETWLTVDQVSVHRGGDGNVWFRFPTVLEDDGAWYDDGLPVSDGLAWAGAVGKRLRVTIEVAP